MNKVSNLTNKSASYEHAKLKNTKNNGNNVNSANTGNNGEHDNIFSNFYLVLGVFIIAMCFIGYVIYYYINTSSTFTIIANSSFYGTDLINYEPLFQQNTKTVSDCIDICTNNIICDGITYNTDTNTCMGTKNGTVRNETSSYNAWVKPPDLKPSDDTSDFTKSILVGYTTNKKNVNGTSIQNPYTLGFFVYSFNITIYDFYSNFGSWRHIFHKGTAINDGTILNYQSWENLIKDFPQQSIGVWLAPFTNNIRIAITTTSLGNQNNGSYSQAFIEECDSITGDCYITDMPNGKWADVKKMGDNINTNPKINTFVEFFDQDLQNVPINRQINITLNFIGTSAEVYFDGKIIKVVKLDGIPSINNASLYVMNEKTFGGEISNLLYFPKSLTLEEVNTVVALSPKKSI